MNQVTSKDGTSIAYERIGGGPAVILVGGGLVDRSENAPLAPELARHFTVYNYDRRGRGESGDTQPYAVEREFEDIEALIAAARAAGTHGPVHLYGVSSGGGLALEAAAAGLAIDKVAVYEVPYCVAGDTPQRSRSTSTDSGRRTPAWTPTWVDCHSTSSIRPQPRSQRASRTRIAGLSKVRHTWPTQTRSHRCSSGSSQADAAVVHSITSPGEHIAGCPVVLPRRPAVAP